MLSTPRPTKLAHYGKDLILNPLDLGNVFLLMKVVERPDMNNPYTCVAEHGYRLSMLTAYLEDSGNVIS
jgi:hypothetical protein